MLNGNLLAKEYTVDSSGPITSIKTALQMAKDGDRIIIKPGVYREGNISIDKSLEIIGVGWPEIDGEGKYEVITVRSDNVTIRGIVVLNAGVSFIDDNAGINLEDVKNCTIMNNKFISNFFAIYLAKAANCRIIDNEIIGNASRQSNSGNGIHLWYCKDIVVDNNQVTGHRDGIYFEFVEDSRVTNNRSQRNLRYGLHFMFSDRCKYTRNSFYDNGAGVAVMYTKRVEMMGNRFEDNWGSAAYGLLLKEITDSKIQDNVFLQNSVGVYLEACSRNELQRNEFIRNGWAVKIMASSINNAFSENNFEANSFDVATNSRHNFNSFDGNYWSSYTGYDLDRDGFGDLPYRPVSLFSVLVEKYPPALILLRSLFVDLLAIAEEVIPALTPETLVDHKPSIKRIL